MHWCWPCCWAGACISVAEAGNRPPDPRARHAVGSQTCCVDGVSLRRIGRPNPISFQTGGLPHENPFPSHTLLAPALFLFAGWAQALEIQPYAANTLQQLQTQGKAVALHFHADWCPTCRAQETSLRGLQGDPQLKDVTLLVVNYDNERDLKKTLKRRRRNLQDTS